MDSNVLTFIKVSFKVACLIAAFVFLVMWVHRYQLNEDTTVIENRHFFTTEDDVMPVFSMCFQQGFDDTRFSGFGNFVDKRNYALYLSGEYFDKRFTDIDYHNVSTNISEFIISYDVHFFNSTVLNDLKYNCLLYTSPSPRDVEESRMPSSA